LPESKHRRRRGRALPREARSAGSLAAARPRRKKTNKFYIAASAIIAVLVIAGFAVGGLGRGGGGGQSVTVGRYNEFQQGIGVQHPIMPDTYPIPHVPDSQTVEYSTTPPTSGKHLNRWAECGFYTEGLPDERITHNLEHGNIVVSYNLATDEEVDQLRNAVVGIDFYDTWGLTRFYDKIPEGTVALSTWGVMDTIVGIDQDRMNRFFDAYAGNLGTETIPCGLSHLATG
jgi:hypothetical protein